MKKGNNEGSIRRRSNGTWEGRYSDGRDDKGKQIQRSVYGKTRKEVAEKLNTILHNKQTGSYVTPNKLLLKDWLIQWLQNYASVSIRPSTYISYNHIIPILGDIPIQQITPAAIQNFYNQKFENGRTDGKGGLSAKTNPQSPQYASSGYGAGLHKQYNHKQSYSRNGNSTSGKT